MKRFTTLVVVVVAALAAGASSALAAPHASQPVVKWMSPTKLGDVVATPMHLAAYTWNKENDGKVHCTGSCAMKWPPITVKHGTMVEKHIMGLMGTFGTIMRPDGSEQVTWNGHPLYTYHGDMAKTILCNGVDGWFVVKA